MLQQTLEETNTPCTPKELDHVPDRGSFADPDAFLVEALKARNAAAFDDLVKQFGRRLLNVAMKITKNREDAEDVVQEAFLKVFKNIDGFRSCSKFASWLTRIAINQALMMIRGNRQKFVSIDEGTEIENRFACLATAASGYTPEQLCSQHEFEDVLLNLTNVRESSRRVMELHLNDGLSEVELSQVLSLSLSAVKARLHRGRLDLREAISRRFRSTKLAQACKKMFPTDTRRTNVSVDLLSKAHLVHSRRSKNDSLNSTSVSRLPSDNPLTKRYSQGSCDVESCLPDHFDPQQLTRPRTPQIGGPEIAL